MDHRVREAPTDKTLTQNTHKGHRDDTQKAYIVVHASGRHHTCRASLGNTHLQPLTPTGDSHWNEARQAATTGNTFNRKITYNLKV